MHNHILPLIITACIISGCNVASAPTQWQKKMTSANGHYQAVLSCTTMPSVGRFQDCQVTFEATQGETAGIKAVQIEGGMPHHGHGLPTSPVMQPQDIPDTYYIEGLKYTMYGAWLLGFKVSGTAGDDKIIFDFVI